MIEYLVRDFYGILYLSLIFAAVITLGREESKKKSRLNLLVIYVAYSFVCFFILNIINIIFYPLNPFLEPLADRYDRIMQFAVDHTLNFIFDTLQNEWATIPSVILAILLYRMRRKHRYLYGLGEVAVGIVAVWAALHVKGIFVERSVKILDDVQAGVLLTKALTLISGIYIIIRGLDNMEQGRSQRSR